MLMSHKRLAVLVAVLFVFVGLVAGESFAAELKVGVINVQKVLLTCDAGKVAKEKVDAKMKELQETFKKEEEALKALQDEIKKKSSAWSEEKKAEKVREYQKNGRELQVKTDDAKFEMKQLQDKEVEPILKALEKVVEKYGKEKGYSAILEARNGLYFDDSIDITDTIVKKLNESMTAK
jgi:outer membrane protein